MKTASCLTLKRVVYKLSFQSLCTIDGWYVQEKPFRDLEMSGSMGGGGRGWCLGVVFGGGVWGGGVNVVE